jgi:hypothetical protein
MFAGLREHDPQRAPHHADRPARALRRDPQPEASAPRRRPVHRVNAVREAQVARAQVAQEAGDELVVAEGGFVAVF